jgi:hypothetical protein
MESGKNNILRYLRLLSENETRQGSDQQSASPSGREGLSGISMTVDEEEIRSNP